MAGVPEADFRALVERTRPKQISDLSPARTSGANREEVERVQGDDRYAPTGADPLSPPTAPTAPLNDKPAERITMTTTTKTLQQTNAAESTTNAHEDVSGRQEPLRQPAPQPSRPTKASQRPSKRSPTPKPQSSTRWPPPPSPATAQPPSRKSPRRGRMSRKPGTPSNWPTSSEQPSTSHTAAPGRAARHHRRREVFEARRHQQPGLKGEQVAGRVAGSHRRVLALIEARDEQHSRLAQEFQAFPPDQRANIEIPAGQHLAGRGQTGTWPVYVRTRALVDILKTAGLEVGGR